MKARALGIDVGTSGVRCAALHEDGEIAAGSEAAMNECGGDLRDPAVWAKTLELSLGRLAERLDLSELDAAAVDGTSGSVLGLDSAGEAVGKALMYDDAIARADILDPIAAAAPRESAAHGASSALARACVLQERSGVVGVAHQADWIASLLAEAPLPSDESNALKTGYDPVTRRWPGWIARTRLDPALLPEVVPCGTRTGTASGAFGLRKGMAIVAGVTDGCASFLATGASHPGDGVSALGTTLAIKLLSDGPVFAPEFGVYSHRVGDLWLAGGASNSGGGAIAAFFAPEEIAALSERIDSEADSGLDYYPLPKSGERFPISDPSLPPRLDRAPKTMPSSCKDCSRAWRASRLSATRGSPNWARLPCARSARRGRARATGPGAQCDAASSESPPPGSARISLPQASPDSPCPISRSGHNPPDR